ncbi:uroporphyrinogen decarboxylase family protein [Eubacterium sp.]|uniref:uroporphyrinogen decarboxylase family protein n=1 Tax=Eubacterium sp. TaxID=142586 RepID=UPI0026DEB4F7|nr:uroporphyrinogen decarboxylase family protein [Eubacterium sp.]MDO5434233.1 uroporphyrinogen decarboxylase family protein [Eubacterium sp.]
MSEQNLTQAQIKKAERTKMFEDVYSGVIPKRVPIKASMTPEAALEYSNIPVGKTIWDLDPDSITKALDKVCEMIPSDTPAVGGIIKNPAVFKLLGSKGYYMGKTGYMQHADLESLKADEYDEFIKDPFAFIVTKSLPRIFGNLDTDSPRGGMVLAEAMKAFYDYQAKFDSIKAPVFAKYGYYAPPNGSTTLCQASFDLIGDFLRGLKGIYMDVRQRPEKIMEACEAMLPMQVKRGLPAKIHKLGEVFMPLHLGTFLRKKDFEKIYWPSFSKFIHIMAEHGQAVSLFCEQDWMRYLDLLQDLPANTRILFEYGDPKIIKEKLGNKHILSGLYPITYIKTATKQQCIDKAKEMIDIMAPGGRYIFDFDKSAMSLDTINIENYAAVIQYVAENTNYTNAGTAVKAPANQYEKPDTTVDHFKSPCFTDWQTVEKNEIETNLKDTVDPILQSYEEMLFRMIFTII